jgi:hypothetical protein
MSEATQFPATRTRAAEQLADRYRSGRIERNYTFVDGA